ncbi:hypothetical protein ABBQ38_008611 [Trebouxia sp. C0009 RCD-2024]
MPTFQTAIRALLPPTEAVISSVSSKKRKADKSPLASVTKRKHVGNTGSPTAAAGPAVNPDVLTKAQDHARQLLSKRFPIEVTHSDLRKHTFGSFYKDTPKVIDGLTAYLKSHATNGRYLTDAFLKQKIVREFQNEKRSLESADNKAMAKAANGWQCSGRCRCTSCRPSAAIYSSSHCHRWGTRQQCDRGKHQPKLMNGAIVATDFTYRTMIASHAISVTMYICCATTCLLCHIGCGSHGLITVLFL